MTGTEKWTWLAACAGLAVIALLVWVLQEPMDRQTAVERDAELTQVLEEGEEWVYSLKSFAYPDVHIGDEWVLLDRECPNCIWWYDETGSRAYESDITND